MNFKSGSTNRQRLRIAFLTTDNREHSKDYNNSQPHFGSAPEALLQGFGGMSSEVEVHVISCLQKTPIWSPSKLADNIYYHALHVPKIGWMKTGYLGCIRVVRRKLREIQPDLVHGQGTERDCSMCAVFSGFPNVLTIHGNMRLVAEFLRAKPLTYYWFASSLERLCLRKTDGVVAISSYTQSNVAPYTRRTWLVPNAVHPSFFNLPRRPGSPPRILCAANISSRKNQIGLIKALEPFAATRQLKLVFAGGGSKADAYFQNFQQMVGERPWCEYLGALDRNTLQNEMSQATMGILPSFEDNCPRVVLEAAAAGLPFAASRVGGIPDLIKHNVTGLLFDPSSSDEISAAIARFVSEKNSRQNLADAALSSCKNQFAAEAVAQEHLSIYSTVLNRGADASNNFPVLS
jgi:glycosyltransferase involved in cell wall biosynthesis